MTGLYKIGSSELSFLSGPATEETRVRSHTVSHLSEYQEQHGRISSG